MNIFLGVNFKIYKYSDLFAMIFKYFPIISGFNLLLLAIAVQVRKFQNIKTAMILLMLLVLMISYSISIYLHNLIVTDCNYTILKWYLPIDGLFLLLMGPCLYFYVSAMLNRPIKLLAKSSLLHLIPLLPCLLFNLNVLKLSSTQRLEWLINDYNTPTIESNVLNVCLYITLIIHLSICYRLVVTQLKISTIIISGHYKTNISWLKPFVVANLLYVIFSAPLCFYFATERTSIIIGQLAMDLQFLYLFFCMITNKDAYYEISILENEKERMEDTCKITTFKIDDCKAEFYLKKLEHVMNTHKPYLLEECSVQMVADQIDIPSHQLSILINHFLQKKFTHMINEYRVEEAKRLLTSPESCKITIEAIGLDCGFGTKNTFYRVFKKHANNMTPFEYQQHSRRADSLQ